MAEWIARDLEKEGFEPLLQCDLPEALPLPRDPNAFEKLKEMLSRFAEKAGPSGSSYAHLVHPGTSFWADRSELPLVGQELGLNVVCPPGRVMSLFADKLSLLSEGEKLGIPNLVLDYNPIYSVREVEETLARHAKRFPFLLKSSRGGSSHGLLVLQQPEDLERKLPLWIEQLRRNAGEVILFAEKYVEGARHITVPFARLMNGKSRCFPFMDSSLQCRHRKVIEFCPALGLDAGMESRLEAWTLMLAEKCGFYGVGSLEFLVDGPRAYLIEGVPRLNTGFALWEKVAGTSAVAWQLAAMDPSRKPVAEKPEREWSHGVSLRFYSEDSLLQLPQPGVIRELSQQRSWRFPGAAAEFSTSYEQGSEVPSTDVGLLGILFVGAQDRKQAATVARGILDELWIAGSLQTNERFLSELIFHPWVKEGMFHAGFIDEEFIPELRPEPEVMRIFASVCASLGASPAGTEAKPERRWAVGDQWVKPDAALLHWVGNPERWQLEGNSGISGTLEIPDGRRLRVCAYPVSSSRWQVRIGSWVLAVRRVDPSSTRDKAPRRLMSLVSGQVHSLLFRENSTVAAHEPLLVVESLRTLVPHALPADARILQWHVSAEQWVQAGQELASFELVSTTKN